MYIFLITSLIIILSILLISSIILNVLLWKSAERQMELNEIYLKWISNFRSLTFKTYSHMKLLDDNHMFEKDDDVGIAFKNMVEIIKDLNDKTEEEITDNE